MIRFAVLRCGHWIADPLDVTRVGKLAPCPAGHADQLVIARPIDADATFITDPKRPTP
jgi:hypothetical protein